jgi:tetratricopeptide (TPR) repeat protein
MIQGGRTGSPPKSWPSKNKMNHEKVFNNKKIFCVLLVFKTWRLSALVVILFSHQVFAQTVIYPAASTAVPLDYLEGTARDLALGSAFVGIADDSSAIFFNSAGLSGLKNPELSLNHNSYFAGTFQETLVAGFPAGDFGGLGFALNYINWGSLDLRDSFGGSQGSYNDSDVGFTAAWGREWAPGFSLGLALRGLQQKVVDNLYSSLAADLGLLWLPEKNLRLGLAYLNLGTPVAGDALEQELRGGGSVLFQLSSRTTLLTALSGTWNSSNELASAQIGAECSLDQRWTLRAGYQLPFFNNQIGGFTDFSAGAGVRFADLTLDYAYLPFGDLGTSNRISLTYQFDLPKEIVKVQVPVTVVQPEVQPAPASGSPAVEMHFKIADDPLAEGQALEKEGKFKEAAQVYVTALKDSPQDDQLWSALGRLYYQLGRKTYAIESFENALKLKPDPSLANWLEKYKTSSSP